MRGPEHIPYGSPEQSSTREWERAFNRWPVKQKGALLMKQFIRTIAFATFMLLTAANGVIAHSDRGEKRPQTYSEAVIPMTKQEFRRETNFRHPPGNVRAEDMYALFAGTVLVVNRGRKSSTVPGVVNHALKVISIGKDGRYVWCSYGFTFDYYHRENRWAPVKFKHAGKLFPMLNAAIEKDFNPKRPGISPLYDGTTGQIVWYRLRKTWHTKNPGHIQERLPRAVYTLCPEFPSPEELGVGVNEAQTAITYDKLLQQDPGRRILRPDLITLNPIEVIE